MTEIRCRELVGAYAVGALEPPEAAVLADHLLTCLRCRHVLAEAEETAAMLAAVPPEMFLDEPADPNDPLLFRTLQAIRLEAAAPPQVASPTQAQAGPAQVGPRRQPGPMAQPIPRQPVPASAAGGFPGWSGQTARSHRRRAQASSASQQRRRYKLVGAAAAAVLVLGGGVMLGSKLAGDTGPSTSPTQAASVGKAGTTPSSPATTAAGARTLQGTSPTTGVSATVDVTPSDGVVQLSGTVTGLKDGQKYKLYVKSAVANSTQVGTWTAKNVGTSGASFDLVASVDPADVAIVEILNAQDEVLVSAN